ncbi:MAG: NUDIX domain-containing protein [Kaistella sp.]|nr:NUDIX domain-containing protein [Kaistella sp.]
MGDLNYCPKCGENTLIWDGEKKWNCNACDFVLYNNIAAAVAVVIRCGDEILLTKRNQMPKKGKLDLAGGFVDPEESAEQTCVRELFEELQLKLEPSKLKYLGSFPNTYHYKGIDYRTLDLFYEYNTPEKFPVSLEISEISETVWIPLQEIDPDDLAFDSQKYFFQHHYR